MEVQMIHRLRTVAAALGDHAEAALRHALLLGAGTPDVWFLVLLYFVTDLLVAVLIYLVSLLLLSAFDRRDRKKAA